jgi:hypothetical protein
MIAIELCEWWSLLEYASQSESVCTAEWMHTAVLDCGLVMEGDK